MTGPRPLGGGGLGVGSLGRVSSARSAAVTTRGKHRDRHPRKWAPCAHEVRCAHAQKGTARRHGANYRCGMQSRCNRASIMHPPRHAPTPVLSLRALASTASELSPTRTDASHTSFIGTGPFSSAATNVQRHCWAATPRPSVVTSCQALNSIPLSGISIATGVSAHLNRWQCD